MESQNHKREYQCATNSNRRICEFGAACNHVSKYYKRQFQIQGKIYCKTSILYSEFVSLRIVWIKSSLDFLLGVCRKPTDPPNLIQPNPTHRVKSVFKAWWVGLGYKKIFYAESSWVWVIKLQTRKTQLDPPIFNIYFIFNNYF